MVAPNPYDLLGEGGGNGASISDYEASRTRTEESECSFENSRRELFFQLGTDHLRPEERTGGAPLKFDIDFEASRSPGHLV